MKRFSKLERARPEPPEAPAEPAAPKRFEGIERTRAADPAAHPFAPPPLPDPNVQLELHDRYSEQVEDARRGRQIRATESLVRLEQEVAAREQPHRVVGVLDLLAQGAAIGPLARVGTETRLWLVGASLIGVYFAIALALGALPAFVGVGALAAALAVRGRLTA